MKISAIIPAYNEEMRIINVLEPISKFPLITEIVVVDDGSQDRTSLAVSEYSNKYSNINLIKMSQNKGKAEAIKIALQNCDCDIILLLDADLIGLTTNHIESLILPLLEEEVEMTIGVFQSGRFLTDLAQKIAPNLSGQRAFMGYLRDDILDLNMSGYSLEMAISKYIQRNNIRTKQILLKDISHVMKEEKVGLSKGMILRVKMYKDILKYWLN